MKAPRYDSNLNPTVNHDLGINATVLVFGSFPPPPKGVHKTGTASLCWRLFIDQITALYPINQEAHKMAITRYTPDPRTGSLTNGTVQHDYQEPKAPRKRKKAAAKK
ncbi:MAG: hypothetical protein GY906_24545 [bacterium]|nr:hypothetical protein [bacterium]